MTVLLCDLGGTNCRFAVEKGGQLGAITALTNDEYDSFDAALKDFIRQTGTRSVDRLVVALAAPTHAQSIELTNRNWVLSSGALSDALDGAEVTFLNDLQAVALGLSDTQCASITLREGIPDTEGNRLILNIGTGFNTAAITPNGTVITCEAGHATFPVETEFDRQVQRLMTRRFGRCSLDRVLSGAGMRAVYDTATAADPSPRTNLPNEAILEAALHGDDATAQQACTEFCRIAGRAAGDLALTFYATGGLWITGGLGRALRPFLDAPDTPFYAAFVRKGRMTELANAMPVHMMQGDDAALFGCLRFADHRKAA